MKIQLSGKKALVGGASSGIGAAIAIELAKCGASVVLMARNEAKLKKVLTQLDRSLGQEHSYLITDFNNYDKHKKVMSVFFNKSDIDILVNNTQGPSAGSINDLNESDYQEAFDLLFKTAVLNTELALPGMRKKGYGRIINVSSMTVKEPQDNLILSNSMRIALVSWLKSLSKSVAQDGITANSVMTGYFDTDRLNNLMKSQAEREGVSEELIRTKRVEQVPIKRLGYPREYGYLVAFIASDFASYLNGVSIPLDGGIGTSVF